MLVFLGSFSTAAAMPVRNCPAPANAYFIPNGRIVWIISGRLYQGGHHPDYTPGVITAHVFTCEKVPQALYYVRFAGRRYLWLKSTQFQFVPGPQRSVNLR